MTATRIFDVAVIGTGFGGLGTALTAASLGMKVLVFEAMGYPGGCASTFERGGHRFESGATLFAGFGEGQLLRRWIDEHDLPVDIEPCVGGLEFRSPRCSFKLPETRDGVAAMFGALPGAPSGVARFFRAQQRLADRLWSILDEPDRLPPWSAGSLLRLLPKLPGLLPVVRLMGRPLSTALRRHGVLDFDPLRTYIDAICQITVQCDAASAEAPFAMSVLDYAFRGAAHVRGGIGVLAEAICARIRALGGEVLMSHRVRSVKTVPGGFDLVSKTGTFRARAVAANLLPQDVQGLVDFRLPRRALRSMERIRAGWSAVMLYWVCRSPPGAPLSAHHLQIVVDPTRLLVEGNHLFVSVSSAFDAGRVPEGHRALTVSTHVALERLRDRDEIQRASLVQEIQDRLRRALSEFAPEWAQNLVSELPASPRTFERFTLRAEGLVGGIPRRTGLWNYLGLGPMRLAPGFHLVGDTVFPGQSVLATATGGVRCAEQIRRDLKSW